MMYYYYYNLYRSGQVVHAEINKNRDGKSKGNGTVQFKTPLEAINAVCILKAQDIYSCKRLLFP